MPEVLTPVLARRPDGRRAYGARAHLVAAILGGLPGYLFFLVWDLRRIEVRRPVWVAVAGLLVASALFLAWAWLDTIERGLGSGTPMVRSRCASLGVAIAYVLAARRTYRAMDIFGVEPAPAHRAMLVPLLAFIADYLAGGWLESSSGGAS